LKTKAKRIAAKRHKKRKKRRDTGGEPLWCAANDLAIFDLTAPAAEKRIKQAAPGNDPALGSSVT
jgi:hypothetical protein